MAKAETNLFASELPKDPLELAALRYTDLGNLAVDAFLGYRTLGRVVVGLLVDRERLGTSLETQIVGSVRDEDATLADVAKANEVRESQMVKPETPEEILKFTALQFKELGMLATDAHFKYISLEKERLDLLLQRAILIVSLPNVIMHAIEQGKSFPESEMPTLKRFANIAASAIERAKEKEGKIEPSLTGLLSNEFQANKSDLDIFIKRIYPDGQIDSHLSDTIYQ